MHAYVAVNAFNFFFLSFAVLVVLLGEVVVELFRIVKSF
jgi:hypothetical protein